MSDQAWFGFAAFGGWLLGLYLTGGKSLAFLFLTTFAMVPVMLVLLIGFNIKSMTILFLLSAVPTVYYLIKGNDSDWNWRDVLLSMASNTPLMYAFDID